MRINDRTYYWQFLKGLMWLILLAGIIFLLLVNYLQTTEFVKEIVHWLVNLRNK